MGFQLFGSGRGISRGRAVCSSEFRRFPLDIGPDLRLDFAAAAAQVNSPPRLML